MTDQEAVMDNKGLLDSLGSPIKPYKRLFKALNQTVLDTENAIKDAIKGDWVIWGGGAMPVPKGTKIDVEYRDGTVWINLSAGDAQSSRWWWCLKGQDNLRTGGDIVKYRLVNQEVNALANRVEDLERENFELGVNLDNEEVATSNLAFQLDQLEDEIEYRFDNEQRLEAELHLARTESAGFMATVEAQEALLEIYRSARESLT